LSRQAERFYAKLQKNVRVRVREALLNLENQPYDGKRLHGELKENYSLRVGKIRIIYTCFRKRQDCICNSYRAEKNHLQVSS